ncbi:hypothetical protein ACQP1O_23395 [Nocardia sp. CA-151230]|uniref:hypothetical protein n=1 Tax=Nocardia sp. CA-151230 TaxID=3239982 RepID=UPI003D94DEAA
MNAATRDLWLELHRFCADDPASIESLDEARFVLSDHAEHGPTCKQFHAALRRASGEVTA